MRTKLTLAIIAWLLCQQLTAQRNCSTASYQADPSSAVAIEKAETFARQYISNNNSSRVLQGTVIKIPVVVHILYHYPSENISDAEVFKQIEILNQSFRRKNADTANTPLRFASVAADCEIEFHLAISDAKKRSTSGIIRKYTPIKEWEDDDKMKFSAEMGDDAWDSKSYLNIWVCNLRRVAGYSTLPGGPAEKDGIVIGFPVFGFGHTSGFDKGRTAVHEVGHWLGLRHLWGDEYCGDDGVSDTPKQGTYNAGCPTGIRLSCSNGPDGDMYMNYMDFTNDVCMNLFTKGQAQRMRAFFAAGGARNSITTSTGLNPPLILESPLPEESPKWLHPQLYPNPTISDMTLDLSYDVRWLGKVLTIMNMQGQVVMQTTISAKLQTINVSKLQAGMYVLTGKKEDGETIKQKFIKL
ncbi:MAG TPA: M43 family zinc metalloprotease [Chitinophagaceae bacterium]